uniref:Uncharacterized protein LOC111109087 n=1 Tax=Crassostrea virginica TaxID=6565 RepID=A0A8B8BBS8_CRAVI|nr:uncharacterized protein LOC111109087 [Crassostrea virginica]
MATREGLKKTNISVLRALAADLGIDAKKKKKDDLICDIITSQTPTDCLTPVVNIANPDTTDPIDLQFKENLPPFNVPHYCLLKEFPNPPLITFTDVYDFMVIRRRTGGQSAQNFKGLDKSVKHFDAGDIQEICMARIDDSTAYVKAFCLASMKKQRYQVFLCITSTGGKHTVEFAYCQCPIGLAQACSHVGGLLFTLCHIQQTVNKSSTGDADQISCTSNLCKWKIPRNLNKKPSPMSTLNLSRPKVIESSSCADFCSDATIVTSSTVGRFDPRHSEDREQNLDWSLEQLSKLKACFPETGMNHLWNIPDSDVPAAIETEVEVEESLHPLHLKMEKMVFSTENTPPPTIEEDLVRYIEEQTREQRMSRLWKALHYGRITSSMFGDVLQSGDNPASLLNQILHGSNLDKYSTLPPAVQWGLDHESSAKADYLGIKKSLDETTQVFETGLTLYPTHSFLGATSDGRVVENEGSSEGLLEIKCPYSIKGQNISHYEIPDIISMNDKNFCLEMLTTEPTLKKTHKYYAQVQGEMAIKGLPWVDFVVWTAAASNNIFVERVLFDVQYVSSMMPKLVNFYMEKIYPLLYTD